MLFNYNTFLITEASKTEKLKKKQEDKIKKFFDNPDVWLYFTSLTPKYSVWFANQFKIIMRSLNSYRNLNDQIFKSLLLNKFSKDTTDKSLNKSEKEQLQRGFNKDVKKMVDGYNSEIHYIIDWFHSPIREEEIDLSKLDMDSAWSKSDEWHKSLKASGLISDESGKILIEFPDGYYWIDLQKSYCRDEADAMGHCGTTNYGNTLLSLRHKKSPHVTVAYDTEKHIIFQMKGRNNTKPIDKYHPYIYRLLIDPNVNVSHIEYEWSSEDDFSIKDLPKEQIRELFETKPDIIIESLGGAQLLFSLYEDKEISKNELRKFIMNRENVDIGLIMNLVEFQSDEDYDNYFTEEEIKQIVNKANVQLTDLIALKMYKAKYINKEKFADYFKDLYLDEKGEVRMRVDDFSDFNFLDENMQQILNGEFDFDYYGGGYDYSLSDLCENFDSLESLTEIKKALIEYELTFWNDEYELEEVKFTNDNLKISNGDLYYEDGDLQIDFIDILTENEDELEGIVTAMRQAVSDGEQSAYYSEIWKQSKDAVEEEFGEWEQVPEKTKNKKGEEVTKYFYSFECPTNQFNTLIDHLEDQYMYNGEVDYEEDTCNEIMCIFAEFVEIDSATLNMDYWSDGPSSQELEEIFVDRLDDNMSTYHKKSE